MMTSVGASAALRLTEVSRMPPCRCDSYGYGLQPPYDVVDDVPIEIYDPAAGAFTLAGSTTVVASNAERLRDGRILLVGHVDMRSATDPNPVCETWPRSTIPATGRSSRWPAHELGSRRPARSPMAGAPHWRLPA